MTAVGKVVKVLSVKLNHDGGALTEYQTAITAVKEVATRTEQTTTVASGETATDVGPTQWAIELSYNVDWAADSLHRILLENDGETATIEWKPDPALTVKRTATVRLVAPGTDATVGNYQTNTITLPVVGTITTV
jgi:hypothetical protein